MKLSVLGAGRCVTGSKYLLEWKGFAAMVDCGLFQGPAENRRRNWKRLPFPPARIGAVVLTHAHIDHSGWLPRLVRQGFRGPVYCTPPTRDLLRVLLPDAAHIQEEEARYANKKGYSKHEPALPLFRAADARAALKLLEPVAFEQQTAVQFLDDVLHTLAEEKASESAGELRLYVEDRVPAVEKRHDEQHLPGDEDQLVGDPEGIPETDRVVLRGNRFHRS